jgi:plastocyanin
LYVVGSGHSKKEPVIDQKDKAFTSKIAIGSPHSMIKFTNSDTFDHNIYANDKKQKVKFDVGLMTPNNSTNLSLDWPAETLVRVGCKIHPKMRSYVANITSDHLHAFKFKKKVKAYDFKIQQVPSDKNQLILLMPKYPKQTIDISKGQTKTIEIKRKGKIKATLTISRT